MTTFDWQAESDASADEVPLEQWDAFAPRVSRDPRRPSDYDEHWPHLADDRAFWRKAAEAGALTASAAPDVQLVPQPDGTREPEPIETTKQTVVPTRAALDEAIDVLEQKATAVVLDALAPVMASIADRVSADLSTAGLVAAAVDDLTTILDEWGAAVDASVLPYYEEVYRLGGLSAVGQMVELGGAVPEDYERLASHHMDAAARHLAVAKDRFMQVGNDAWQESRIVMLNGLEQGRSVDAIAEDLRGIVTLTEAEARMIARTEVVSAANAGAFEQARLAGEDAPLYKQWIATMDRRTRETHDAADAQVVGLNERFQVGGASLLYPGDPAGPPGEVINCRCSLIFTDDPQGMRIEEGLRQTGGVVEDVVQQAPMDEGIPTFEPEVPRQAPLLEGDDLTSIRNTLEEFKARPVPEVRAGSVRPSEARIAYEEERTRIGALVDSHIRRAMEAETPNNTVFTRLNQDRVVEYRQRQREVLEELGVEFGHRDIPLDAMWTDEDFAAMRLNDRETYEWIRRTHAVLPRRFNESIATHPLREILSTRDGSAWYSQARRVIGIPEDQIVDVDDIATLLHEMNHHIAAHHPGLHEAEYVEKFIREAFLHEPRPGIRPRWETLTRDEVSQAWVRADRYSQPYMGRDYGNTPSPKPQRPDGSSGLAELWTSSIEAFLDDHPIPMSTADWEDVVGKLNDPRLRAWINGMLLTFG